MKLRNTWILCILSLASPSSMVGQTTSRFRIIPEKVLAKDGDIVSRETVAVPFPPTSGIGKVFQEVIPHKGDSARLHFLIHEDPEKPTWALRVLDGSGRLAWSFLAIDIPIDHVSRKHVPEFWSGEIPGNSATVEVYSLEENSPLKLLIDKIEVSSPTIKPQAITPPDDRKPITNYPEFRPWGNAVAQLRFIRGSNQLLCTGFMVSDQLLITNNHCISNDNEMRSTLVEFGYDSDVAIRRTLQCKEIVLSDFTLDYTILRLATSPGAVPLKLADSPPSENQALLIIEHPGGEPKQVSITDCKVHVVDKFGQTPDGEAPKMTDFGHLCDTLSGSSGSPVMDINTGNVIGLHHLGFTSDSDLLVNQAVKMGLILKQIQQKRPAIFGELARAGM
jgi:V8-like Glu-specific endopeptidase